VSFASFAEFLAMGDHGLYVWLSYGVALIMVLYNVISVRLRRRRALEDVRDSARRGAAPREAADTETTSMAGESEVR